MALSAEYKLVQETTDELGNDEYINFATKAVSTSLDCYAYVQLFSPAANPEFFKFGWFGLGVVWSFYPKNDKYGADIRIYPVFLNSQLDIDQLNPLFIYARSTEASHIVMADSNSKFVWWESPAGHISFALDLKVEIGASGDQIKIFSKSSVAELKRSFKKQFNLFKLFIKKLHTSLTDSVQRFNKNVELIEKLIATVGHEAASTDDILDWWLKGKFSIPGTEVSDLEFHDDQKNVSFSVDSMSVDQFLILLDTIKGGKTVINQIN